MTPSFKMESNRKYVRILYTSGKVGSIPLDRLMLISFVGEKEDAIIIHRDGNTSNNYITNLKYL